MPRTASFNREEVLESVAQLFREHGFEATSMRHVQQATGLAPTSLYAAFGNKDGLFEEALSHYRDSALDMLSKILGNPDDGLAAIQRFLTTIATSCCAKHGCLLGNSLNENGTSDRANAVLNQAFRRLESLLEQAVQAGQQRGEISNSHSAQNLAYFIQASSFGIQLQAKRGLDRENLKQLANIALQSLG